VRCESIAETAAMTSPAEPAPRVPEKRTGLLGGLRAVLVRPSTWFSSLSGRTTAKAVGLAVLVHIVADPVAVLGIHFIKPVDAPVALATLLLVTAPLGALLGIFVSAAMAYLAARVTSRERPRFSTIVETLAYAEVPFLVAVVPIAGAIVGFGWSIGLRVLGLRRALQRSWLFAVVAVALGPLVLAGAAIAIRTFGVEAFAVPSPSMAPTLFAGDNILVRKNAYGWQKRRLPERGDLVLFPSPERPQNSFVKRVIGLPGDTIRLERGIVFINGWRVPTCVAGLGKVEVSGKEHTGVVLVELLGDTAYLVLHDDAGEHEGHAAPQDQAGQSEGAHANESEEHGHHEAHDHRGGTQGPYTVLDNEVFVLGDNRENSHDSRGWFGGRGGGVKVDHIEGRATAIWMSVDGAGRVDWSRMGSTSGAPKCPKGFLPATCAGLEKCLANRPPRETTTPPAVRTSAGHEP
jgi:signal peptidase I